MAFATRVGSPRRSGRRWRPVRSTSPAHLTHRRVRAVHRRPARRARAGRGPSRGGAGSCCQGRRSSTAPMREPRSHDARFRSGRPPGCSHRHAAGSVGRRSVGCGVLRRADDALSTSLPARVVYGERRAAASARAARSAGTTSPFFPGQVVEDPQTWGLNPHRNLEVVTPDYFKTMGHPARCAAASFLAARHDARAEASCDREREAPPAGVMAGPRPDRSAPGRALVSHRAAGVAPAAGRRSLASSDVRYRGP